MNGLDLSGECYPCGKRRRPINGLCPSCGHPLEIGAVIPRKHGISVDDEIEFTERDERLEWAAKKIREWEAERDEA